MSFIQDTVIELTQLFHTLCEEFATKATEDLTADEQALHANATTKLNQGKAILGDLTKVVSDWDDEKEAIVVIPEVKAPEIVPPPIEAPVVAKADDAVAPAKGLFGQLFKK